MASTKAILNFLAKANKAGYDDDEIDVLGKNLEFHCQLANKIRVDKKLVKQIDRLLKPVDKKQETKTPNKILPFLFQVSKMLFGSIYNSVAWFILFAIEFCTDKTFGLANTLFWLFVINYAIIGASWFCCEKLFDGKFDELISSKSISEIPTIAITGMMLFLNIDLVGYNLPSYKVISILVILLLIGFSLIRQWPKFAKMSATQKLMKAGSIAIEISLSAIITYVMYSTLQIVQWLPY